MRLWDHIAVIKWVYVLSLVFIILTISPRLLNVFLAFVNELLKDASFPLVCVCMFCLGLCLFLLPVVPGAPIFFFGGALLPLKCEWGFWYGAVISIFLGW